MPTLGDQEDELQAAAAWLTSASNPLFAKAQVNRIWYHLMGHGMVHPVDDFRLTNPARHPKLPYGFEFQTGLATPHDVGYHV